MRSLLVALLVSSACAPMTPLPTGAQRDWPGPFTSVGTLGAELEREFSELLRSCGAQPLKRRGSATAIPPYLHDRLRLNARIKSESNDAAALLLAYIFPRDDVGAYDPLQSARYLDASSIVLQELPTPVDLVSQTLHYQNCSGILEAAIEANLDVPVATLQAGAKAEFRDRAAFGIAQGRFRSPLATALAPASPFDVRFPLFLDLWQWYRNNAAAAEGRAYYIDTFEGAGAIEFAEAGRQREYQLETDGSLGFVAGSVRGQARYSSLVSARTTSREFRTYFFLDDANRERVSFKPLPPLADVIAFVGSAQPRPASGSPRVLQSGVRQTLTYELAGVPRALCDQSQWELAARDLGGDLVLESMTATTQRPFCHFEFSFLPDAAVFASNTEGTFNRDFSLRSRDRVATRQLELRFALRMQTSPEPLLRQIGAAPTWSILSTGNNNRLSWELPMQLIDAGTTVTLDRLAVEDPKLQCGAGDIVRPTVEVSGADGGVLRLSVSSAVPANFEPDGDRPVRSNDCTLTGTARLPLRSDPTRTIQRPIEATVEYPAVNVRVSRALLEAVPLQPRRLSLGDVVDGQLTNQDTRLPDDTFAQAWQVEVGSDADVEITMRSPELDSYLLLLGTPRMLQNDDMNDDTLDARITVRLSAGTPYRLIVNTAVPDQVGKYTIRVTTASSAPGGR